MGTNVALRSCEPGVCPQGQRCSPLALPVQAATAACPAHSLLPAPLHGAADATSQGQQHGHSPARRPALPPAAPPQNLSAEGRLETVRVPPARKGFSLQESMRARARIHPCEKAPFRPPYNARFSLKVCALCLPGLLEILETDALLH